MLIIDPPATAGGTDIYPSATPDFEAKLPDSQQFKMTLTNQFDLSR